MFKVRLKSFVLIKNIWLATYLRSIKFSGSRRKFLDSQKIVLKIALTYIRDWTKMKKIVNEDKISKLQRAEISLFCKERTYSIFLWVFLYYLFNDYTYYWQSSAMRKSHAHSLDKLKLAEMTSINGSKGLTKIFAWITVGSNLNHSGETKNIDYILT